MISLPASSIRRGFETAAFLSLAFMVTGCGGGDDAPSSPPPASRTVKYEITGSYTGGLTVAYTTESKATVAADVLSLPWSRSVTFPAGTVGVGLAGGSIVGRFGAAGQTVTVRIYSGATVVKSEVATTTSAGQLSLPSLTYVLP